jgi:hypothetical protein
VGLLTTLNKPGKWFIHLCPLGTRNFSALDFFLFLKHFHGLCCDFSLGVSNPFEPSTLVKYFRLLLRHGTYVILVLILHWQESRRQTHHHADSSHATHRSTHHRKEEKKYTQAPTTDDQLHHTNNRAISSIGGKPIV